MSKKNLLSLIAITLVFLGLVFYNYRQAQVRLKDSRQSELKIDLLDSPPSTTVNSPVNFSWHIEAPPSFNAATTTIYWSYNSSGSALTKFDSPLAVGYPNFAPDYVSGRFPLPSDFNLNLTFSKPGVVYYRAFAQVGNDYLWTPEKSLIIK